MHDRADSAVALPDGQLKVERDFGLQQDAVLLLWREFGGGGYAGLLEQLRVGHFRGQGRIASPLRTKAHQSRLRCLVALT